MVSRAPGVDDPILDPRMYIMGLRWWCPMPALPHACPHTPNPPPPTPPPTPHAHAAVYARTCPVYGQQCRGPNVLDGSTPVRAPVHVIAGWGGPTDWDDLTNSSYANDAYFPVKSGEDQFGFLELNVNRTHLKLEAIPVDVNGDFEPLAPIDTIIIPAPVF